MNQNTPKYIVSQETTIKECLQRLNQAGVGILLVCDSETRLQGVITDGDIRRAFLKNISFEKSCSKIANTSPLTVTGRPSNEEALHLMSSGNPFTVHQLPVLDEHGKVKDLILRSEISDQTRTSQMNAVIMAGGFGTRLRPFTKSTPKPMLPVGGTPLLERIIDQLKKNKIDNINITTHYLPEKIKDYFGNGEKYGVNINYITEDEPLGTAGALGFIEKSNHPVLIINGDILTQVDFSAMLNFHKEQKSALTIGVRMYEFKIPFGVVECAGPRVCTISEKPVKNVLVNAGIYLMEPEVHARIPQNKFMNMTDVIELLLKEGKTVSSFPIMEYWLDIGQIEDYNKAQSDIKKIKRSE
ncbi:nucleotidyltransferase family protein [Maridesulfovibrio hydrothermalis]|uniref:Nucleotidyltransferase family protein n=1 Tax=Maridesulfovibrio hydrothermalis AM13 = DSM 14728 TaxID=1121451 RepID=L0RCC6_9BACT